MNSRILIIYEYQILYQILNEIRESLNFEITQSNSKDLKELKYDPKNNYLIISKKKIEGIKNSLILENVPIKFEKLILLYLAISGTSESVVSPGCVLISKR